VGVVVPEKGLNPENTNKYTKKIIAIDAIAAPAIF
jgi:hypothetical protein